ncbi:hypothetical protein Q9L58_002026 [Maublancomyces gigas]|uniref:RRM domain-containing protein n=1 Tax=Discina gigas TaxID=1032678 RepID=A0ABR3GSQ9_9PEZI
MASTAPPTAPKQTNPASQTLYIQNLNDKIRKEDLRISLYTLFSTYGCVLDVNALKTMKCRGQAHIAFRDIISATQAMRALHGVSIYGKDMRISYAKDKSHIISKLDGTFKIPTLGGAIPGGEGAVAVPFVPLPSAPAEGTAAGAAAAAAGQKRQREEESEEDEAMDVEDDDD